MRSSRVGEDPQMCLVRRVSSSSHVSASAISVDYHLECQLLRLANGHNCSDGSRCWRERSLHRFWLSLRADMMAGPSSLIVLGAAVGYVVLYQGILDFAVLAFFSVFRQRNLLARTTLDLLPIQLKLKALGASVVAYLTVKVGQAIWPRPEEPRWHGPGKPLLFPCRTTHARMFPKKHVFDYSYLVVGVPVVWEGCAGSMISVGRGTSSKSGSSWLSLQPRLRKGWYHINPEDYLERGHGDLGLRGKLNRFLLSQVRLFARLSGPLHSVTKFSVCHIQPG
jgi:hypothetical protein